MIRRIGLIALVAGLAASVGSMWWLRRTSTRPRPAAHPSLERARQATVVVLAGELVDGHFELRSRGSGSVVHPGGSVLTNHHVIVDPRDQTPYEHFVIARGSGSKGDARPLCVGQPNPGHFLPEHDLALIDCSISLWSPKPAWPFLELADPSTALQVGSPVWLVGHSNPRDWSQEMSAGRVTGWLGAPDGHGPGDYLRSDAYLGHGMSGGSVVDAEGRLVAVATGFRRQRRSDAGGSLDAGRSSLLKRISAARPLMERLSRPCAAPSGPQKLPQSLPTCEESAIRMPTSTPK